MKSIIFIILLLLLVLLFQERKSEYESEPKLKVLISTCKNYREKSIPQLLEQLGDIDVLIVSGGEDTDDFSDPVLKKTRYQFWEYTGLIYVAENPEPDATVYFMMHDTVKLTSEFVPALKKKYKEFLEKGHLGQRLLQNNGGSSMSMGLYSQELIEQNKEFLMSLRDYRTDEKALTESKYKGFGLEDHILKDFSVIYDKSKVQVKYEGNHCVNYIPELGFTKIQTNCQGKPLVFTYDM